MPGLSKDLASYSDVKAVFDTVLSRRSPLVVNTSRLDGISTPGSAQHWVQRANAFRKLWRLTYGEGYEDLHFYFVKDEAKVVVKLRSAMTNITDLDGNPVSVEPAPEAQRPKAAESQSDFYSEAMALRQRLASGGSPLGEGEE